MKGTNSICSLYLFIVLSMLPLFVFGQVAINKTGQSANAHSILDVQSDTLGLLVPRMTTTQRNDFKTKLTVSDKGMLVYDTDYNKYYYFDGDYFRELTNGILNSITDDDMDTYIDVDFRKSDEDKIRYYLGNVKYFSMDGPRFNVENSGGSVFIGEHTGENDDLSGNKNTYVGISVAPVSVTGWCNSAFGYRSLYNLTTGYQNVSSGAFSLYNNTYGGRNTALGYSSLFNNTTGGLNIAIGSCAAYTNDTSDNLLAIGDSALFHTKGEKNIAIGNRALFSDSTGYKNVAVGQRAMFSNKTGFKNTAVGTSCMSNSLTGNYNTAVGYFSLIKNAGDRNTALGALAGGFSLLVFPVNGCVYLGYKAGYDNYEDNRLYIANNENPLIYGEFDNDFVKINGDLEINGFTSETFLKIDADGDGKIIINGGDTHMTQIKFYENDNFRASMGYSPSGGHFFIYHGSHNVFFQNGSILPDSHKAQDLGSSSAAWDDIYCDDLHQLGSAAFTDRKVTEELLLFPPQEKPDGAFDEKTDKGLKELDPNSLPPALHDGYDLLIDEMTTYNYKANYEQQLQIEMLIKKVEALEKENILLKQKLISRDSIRKRR